MNTCYGHLARILHAAADQRITAALAQMDLTAAQGHILGYLGHRTAPPCPKDLEQAFQLSHPTVSGLLSRLEKKGFIALDADSADRRCKRIHLLPRGEQCNQQIRRVIGQFEAQIVQGFSPEEKQQLTQLLTRAIENIKEENTQ